MLFRSQAAAAVGCQTHLVCTGKHEHWAGPQLPEGFPPATVVHADLAAFAEWVLSRDSATADQDLKSL